jgi:hypothetical protein
MPTGIRLKLSKLYGLDSYKGEVVWKNDHALQNCDTNDFDLFYDGLASLIATNKLNTNSQKTHTFIVEAENINLKKKKELLPLKYQSFKRNIPNYLF